MTPRIFLGTAAANDFAQTHGATARRVPIAMTGRLACALRRSAPLCLLWMAAGEVRELLSCGHVHISVLGGNAYPVPPGAFGLIERLVRRLK